MRALPEQTMSLDGAGTEKRSFAVGAGKRREAAKSSGINRARKDGNLAATRLPVGEEARRARTLGKAHASPAHIGELEVQRTVGPATRLFYFRCIIFVQVLRKSTLAPTYIGGHCLDQRAIAFHFLAGPVGRQADPGDS